MSGGRNLPDASPSRANQRAREHNALLFLKKAPARPGVELPAARFQSRKDPRRDLGFAPLPFSSLPASPGAFGVTTAARANARHEQWRGREEGAAARRAHRLERDRFKSITLDTYFGEQVGRF